MIRSNRESGFGRYDIMLIPRPQREGSLPAMVLEFKFYNEKIHHYGFAFKGKEVLIGEINYLEWQKILLDNKTRQML